MAGGRPTKYNADIQRIADEYLDNYTRVIPSVEDLSLHLDVAMSTIHKWAKEYPEFSGTLDRIKKEQMLKVMDGGLMGDFNAAISKLVLHNHGYSDKTEVDNTSSDGSMAAGKPMKIELIAYEGNK